MFPPRLEPPDVGRSSEGLLFLSEHSQVQSRNESTVFYVVVLIVFSPEGQGLYLLQVRVVADDPGHGDPLDGL